MSEVIVLKKIQDICSIILIFFVIFNEILNDINSSRFNISMLLLSIIALVIYFHEITQS